MASKMKGKKGSSPPRALLGGIDRASYLLWKGGIKKKKREVSPFPGKRKGKKNATITSSSNEIGRGGRGFVRGGERPAFDAKKKESGLTDEKKESRPSSDFLEIKGRKRGGKNPYLFAWV